MTHTLVLGAGFGGLECATRLAAGLPQGHRVTLVDANDRFIMGLAKLWLLDGRASREELQRDVKDVERHGVRFVHARVEALDVDARTATVGQETLSWDHLVLALGARMAPDRVPGLKTHAHDLYSVGGIESFHQALASSSGGDVLVLVTALPFKCPPAPYEAAILAHRFLAAKGVEARVAIASPEPQPLPMAGKACGDEVRGWVESRGVEVLSSHAVKEVRANEVAFQDGTTRRFDVLAAVAPHAAPDVLVQAGLTDASGWVPVDAETLATRHAGVWAVGDCNVVKLANGKPLVMAGVMAEGQARVVADNILARVRGEDEAARFDGKGHCFLELGDGLAVEVDGDFYATPTPIVAARSAPSAAALAHKHAFMEERLARWFGS